MFYKVLISLAIILVIITDLTDWPDTIKKVVSFILTKGKVIKTNYNLRIVECSLCQVVWTGILWTVIYSALYGFSIYYLTSVFITAFLTTTIKNVIVSIKMTLDWILAKYQRLIY